MEWDRKRIVELEKLGLSDRRIALELGVSHTALRKVRLRNGWGRVYPGYRSDLGIRKGRRNGNRDAVSARGYLDSRGDKIAKTT